jgi:hypothetical protein
MFSSRFGKGGAGSLVFAILTPTDRHQSLLAWSARRELQPFFEGGVQVRCGVKQLRVGNIPNCWNSIVACRSYSDSVRIYENAT